MRWCIQSTALPLEPLLCNVVPPRPGSVLDGTRTIPSRSNFVCKLVIAFEIEDGLVTDWNASLQNGNPVHSDDASQYSAFPEEGEELRIQQMRWSSKRMCCYIVT